MKIAAVIFTYNLIDQLNILIKQLLCDIDIDIFIHVDKKNESLKKKIISSNRVFVNNDNIEITWGSDSLLLAELIMLKSVIKTNKKYDYLLILSGTELLVKNGLNDFLKSNNGKVFIERETGNDLAIDKEERIRLLHKWPSFYLKLYNKKFHPIRLLRALRLKLMRLGFPFPKKKINLDTSNIRFYKDGIWCAMPFEIAKYVVSFSEEKKEFMKIFKNAMIPEEGFITTLLMNSKYKNSVSYNNGSTIGLMYCNKFQNNHPPVLLMEDVPNIEQSNYFFARKFNINIDSKVVDYFYKKIISEKR